VRRRTTLVVTEHSAYLTPERRERYENVRARLEGIAGMPMDAVHYLDAADLSDAESVVLSGSSAPWAAHDRAELDRLGAVVARATIPVLGICAGMQLMAEWGGGEVRPMAERGAEPELGYSEVDVLDDGDLFAGLSRHPTLFQDHRDEITALPEDFRLLATNAASPIQAVSVPERGWWGTQFHPEWADDDHRDGDRVLRNFFALARGN
jgi:GMP synthase (glutamine-hydrolysing)